MRARSNHRASGGSSLGAGLGALALVGAAALALGSPSTANAQSWPREWVNDNEFNFPLHADWTCTGDLVELPGAVEGRPGEDDYAGCTQKLQLPAGVYRLTAHVAGSFAFVGLTGTDTESGEVALWADGTGPAGQDLQTVVGLRAGATVYFHGWYGQGPYRIDSISVTGPAVPNPCETFTPSPGMTWAPPCWYSPSPWSSPPASPTGGPYPTPDQPPVP